MQDFYSSLDLKYIEIATLVNTCNKYKPGVQQFYIPSLVPFKNQQGLVKTVKNNTYNLQNTSADKQNLGVTNATTGSTISIALPKEHTRWYPTKWVPAGTQFLVTFTGGDITKPKIVGRLG